MAASVSSNALILLAQQVQNKTKIRTILIFNQMFNKEKSRDINGIKKVYVVFQDFFVVVVSMWYVLHKHTHNTIAYAVKDVTTTRFTWPTTCNRTTLSDVSLKVCI